MSEKAIEPEVVEPQKTGESVDRLAEMIGGTISRVAAKVGDSVEGITESMVDSAEGIANMAQGQVRAASNLAQTKAAFKFKALLEESALDHLEEIAERRLALEDRINGCKEGSPTKRFLLQSLESLDKSEAKVLATALNIDETLTLEAGREVRAERKALESREQPRPAVQDEGAVASPSLPDDQEIRDIPPHPPRPGMGTHVGSSGIQSGGR